MPSDIEWHFASGGLQLVDDSEHAVAGSVTLGGDRHRFNGRAPEQSRDRPGERGPCRSGPGLPSISRVVQRAKYELAAPGPGALMALGQLKRGIDELRTALDGIRRLGHPPTL